MVADPTPFEALMAAVELAGSQSALARICGVSATTVWKWVNISKQVGSGCVLCIESKLGVWRSHQRPDLYPPQDYAPVHRFHGVDRHANRVSFNQGNGLKGAAA